MVLGNPCTFYTTDAVLPAHPMMGVQQLGYEQAQT